MKRIAHSSILTHFHSKPIPMYQLFPEINSRPIARHVDLIASIHRGVGGILSKEFVRIYTHTIVMTFNRIALSTYGPCIIVDVNRNVDTLSACVTFGYTVLIQYKNAPIDVACARIGENVLGYSVVGESA